MTAFLCAVLVLWPLGLAREHDSTAAWWLQRPLIIGRLGRCSSLGLIAIFGRFERPRPRRPLTWARTRSARGCYLRSTVRRREEAAGTTADGWRALALAAAGLVAMAIVAAAPGSPYQPLLTPAGSRTVR